LEFFLLNQFLGWVFPVVWVFVINVLNSPTPIWLLLILSLVFIGWILLYFPRNAGRTPASQMSAPVRYLAFDVLWEASPPGFENPHGPFCPDCERELSWKGKNWECIDCKKKFARVPAYDNLSGLGQFKFDPQIKDELIALYRTGQLIARQPSKNTKINRLN
jgi:hypothetical protein